VKLYDIAILGGGAAGLSLALHLSRSPLRDLSIVVVDREAKSDNDRTWCFWTRHASPYDGVLHRSWDGLRFASEGVDRCFSIEPFRYNMLRGADFYRFTRSRLAACPGIEMVTGQVEGVEDGGTEAEVRVEGERLRARWVFDSRFPPPGYRPQPEKYTYLVQHFLGWEVETSTAAFDPHAPTLFDLRTEQRGGLCFFYILPHDEQRALVEYTVFSDQPWARAEYERKLRDYLEGMLGLYGYRVAGTEQGAIPMTDHPFRRSLGRRIMAIGTAGGMVKPSTGYAFARIQRDSRAIVRSLLRHGHPFAVPASPARHRLYDSLMLDVMARRPHLVKPIFTALFTRNGPTRVLRFLDESSSVPAEAALLATLPPRPFLQALWRTVRRRQRGG
jgi:lycopene beta-cyclase